MDSTTAFKYLQQEAQAMKKQFYDNRTDMTNGTDKISQAYGFNLAQLNQEQEPNLLILLCDEAEEKIITQESKVMEIASTHPVDFDRMIKALDELALMERRKKQFEKIKNEMFPEQVACSGAKKQMTRTV